MVTQNKEARTGLATWTIDPTHSIAEFGVRHMMVSIVKGRFGTLSGAIHYDGDDLTARFLTHLRYDAFNTRDGGWIEYASEVVDVAAGRRSGELEKCEEGGDRHGGRILRRTGV